MRFEKKKEEILAVLRSAAGRVSGEEISARLGVSRAAVWKYIKNLRDEGYRIEAATSQGYKFVRAPDLLLPSELRPFLPVNFPSKIYWDRSTGSTNDEAKKLAQAGASLGTLVVAETQSGGRGRRGRGWESPPGGVWFSVILRPDVDVPLVSRISVFSAVVAAEEITAESGLSTTIKWPNDILIDGKKVCGILIELAAELEQVSYIIVGIGINANLRATQLSPDVRRTATTLLDASGKKINRQRLLAKIASRLVLELPDVFGDNYTDYLKRWRELSFILGRRVKIEAGGRVFTGKALDIQESGALIVALDSGEERVFESGDVSLRAG